MVPALINFAQQVVKSMTGNPSFLTPAPTLAVIAEAVTDLQNAENAALARAKGAVATRNEKRTALVMLLQQLKSYVQGVADANVENGASIILSSGMALKKVAVHPPRVFAATPGPVAGAAKIVAPSAAQRASYDWQYSTDGGKTWVTMPSTLQAKTSLTGQASGTTVEFRYRAVTKIGEGDWSPAVALVIK
ncbi:MAG TPA: fibronectin type III domain-containing protein [Polyangiaceae bacterium]|jgi:hypothetical protein